MLPLQPSLLDGWDDRANRQCRLLLYASLRTGSQGRGGLWVIKLIYLLNGSYVGSRNCFLKNPVTADRSSNHEYKKYPFNIRFLAVLNGGTLAAILKGGLLLLPSAP